MRRLLPAVATSVATPVALALGAGCLASVGVATTAQADPPPSPLRISVPAHATALTTAWGGADLGTYLRVSPTGDAVSVWSQRSSYDVPIASELHVGDQVRPLPTGLVDDLSGLTDLVTLSFTRRSDGWRTTVTASPCLAGTTQRTSPAAPPYSPWPEGCPQHPYALGSVTGVQSGWSTAVSGGGVGRADLDPGTYDVTATVTPAWVDALGLSPADATASGELVVKRYGAQRAAEAPPAQAPPAEPAASSSRATAPTGPHRATLADLPQPDLAALPPWGITLNRRGTLLRFSATVWNAGPGPLVIEGFRSSTDDDELDTYQYFFDAEGHQVDYLPVGHMHWHDGNHHHWHLDDFARYVLLDADGRQVVRSGKRSFCLANTDAIDYTVPGAAWKPDDTDLATACGDHDALSVRETLLSGSGDTYAQFRTGQAFRIGGLPNGTYYVAVEANPLGTLTETDPTNDLATRRVVLRGTGEHRRVVVSRVGLVDEAR